MLYNKNNAFVYFIAIYNMFYKYFWKLNNVKNIPSKKCKKYIILVKSLKKNIKLVIIDKKTDK